LGTSIFQLQKEREFAEQNQRYLNQKYFENLNKQQQKLLPHEKNVAFIEEPKPGPNHVICAVCREQFTDYIDHIFSTRHKRGVASNQTTFGQIDSIINEVDLHQREKKANHGKLLLGQTTGFNNPEEGTKSLLSVNIEDTSSGSVAANKVTASTNEQEETMDQEGPLSAGRNRKQAVDQNLGSISIDLEELPLISPLRVTPIPVKRPLEREPEPAKPKRGAGGRRAAKKEEKTQQKLQTWTKFGQA
jgi:hypothetical protein